VNRFKYVLSLSGDLLGVLDIAFAAGILEVILKQRTNMIHLTGVLFVLWYFSVIDALFFGNYPTEMFD
jgi:hypothetical protein